MNAAPAVSGVILIADDNPEARRMLDVRVKREGHQTIMVENGRQALEVLAREPVDVVLLDIEMPELNGYGVLSAVRADPNLAHVPILIISGGGDQDDLIRCIEMGAVDYLPKPFNQAVLRVRITSCLAQKRQRDRERGSRFAVPADVTPPASGTPETAIWNLNRKAAEEVARIADDLPLDAPRRLGRIVLDRLLGSGGMGRVYLGHHELLDLPVAVKLMRGELTAVYQARERLLREARLAVRLAHPSVVRLLEVGETDQGVYLAFEYIAGGTLADFLKRQPERQLPIPTAIRFTTEVAVALAEAHKLGIIHRDIKPANLLLTVEEQIKVGDFGLAKQDVAIAAAGAQLTMEGVVVGTPLYMAPEQLVMGAIVDARVDLYALGSVLFEMLVGHPPFGGGDLPAPSSTGGSSPSHVIFHHLANTAATPPSQHRPDTPPWLDALCLKLLAKSPADRYPTPEAVLTALAAAG